MNQSTKIKKVPKLRFREFVDGWTLVMLGGIADFFKGKDISKADITDGGVNECIRYGELYTRYAEVIKEVYSKTNLDSKSLMLSKYNDVIIPASGETNVDIATASCVLKDDVALGGDINIMRTKHDGVFLSYYLNNLKKLEIAKLAQGNSVVHIYPSQLKTLPLNMPDIKEQNKIAEFLSAAEAKIAALWRKKELLEKYKKATMAAVFSQKNNFKDKNGNDYPRWQKKTLGDIGAIITGKTPSTSNADLWGGDVLFITPTDIDNNIKYQDTAARTVSSVAQAKILPAKSILYTCIASIGKMSLSTKPSITNQQINALVPFEASNNEYVYYALLWITPYIKATRATTTLPIINKTEFAKFNIPFPSYPEQQKIADFLTSIDDKINLTKRELGQAKTFKRVLLQQMFI